SKSLGNGLDPLELVDEFGSDAMKFTLAFLCAQGQDLLVDRESFRVGSRFANKVWNASRYILMNLAGCTFVSGAGLNGADRWIYSRLNRAARVTSEALEGYRYNEAAQAVYEFFWNDFCDWYVEAAKISIRAGGEERDRAVSVLLRLLEEALRLLHPLLPMVTEEIYAKLPAEARGGEGLLITAPYPRFREERVCEDAEEDFALLQELVRGVRALRAECGIAPEKRLRCFVRALDAPRDAFLAAQAPLLSALAGVEAGDAGGAGGIGLTGKGFEAYLYVGDAVDIPALKAKFRREIDKDSAYAAGLEAKLANAAFLAKAPAALVAAEQEKLAAARGRAARLEGYVGAMG
ncbi:MAG: class I tRNA ligase family protein, partial [Treponema sp.]|nr:class I tRNA ligase family protein [Treponema sp.]